MSRQGDAAERKIAHGALSEAAVAKIVGRMKETRLSQAALGFAAGLHQTTVSAICNRTRRPAFDQMVAIASALGVSLDWLADDAAPAEAGPPASDAAAFRRLLDHVVHDHVVADRLRNMLARAASHGERPVEARSFIPFDTEVADDEDVPESRRRTVKPRGGK